MGRFFLRSRSIITTTTNYNPDFPLQSSISLFLPPFHKLPTVNRPGPLKCFSFQPPSLSSQPSISSTAFTPLPSRRNSPRIATGLCFTAAQKTNIVATLALLATTNARTGHTSAASCARTVCRSRAYGKWYQSLEREWGDDWSCTTGRCESTVLGCRFNEISRYHVMHESARAPCLRLYDPYTMWFAV